MKQSEKHLTLHLYRKDEVLGGLRWAIINHNISETIFWGLELFDSDMEQDALEMLECIWITEIGFACPMVLTRILDIYTTGELDRDSWISLLYSISRIQSRDSTIFYLLIRGAMTSTEWIPKFQHSLTYTTIQQAVQDTLLRKKLLDAWLLARALDADEQWAILENIPLSQEKHEFLERIRSSNLSDYIQRAIAFVLTVHSTEEPLIDRELPSEISELIDEWDSQEDLRLRRVYGIRSQALLYLTERSEQNISSESDIQDDLIQTLLESPYWAEILDEYMDDGEWKSDSYKEMFYSTYFISDIPDEWSSEDREKSHGRGLGKPYENGLHRFIDLIFQRSKSIGIWNSTRPEGYIDEFDWDEVYSKMKPECLQTLRSQLPMKPIKKEFIIS